MSLKKDFGNRLKEVRETYGITQESLSDRTGYGTVNISRVENGHVFPSAETIESFAEALGVEVKDLFDFKAKVMVADTSDKKRVISLVKKAKPKQAKLIYEISIKVLQSLKE